MSYRLEEISQIVKSNHQSIPTCLLGYVPESQVASSSFGNVKLLMFSGLLSLHRFFCKKNRSFFLDAVLHFLCYNSFSLL